MPISDKHGAATAVPAQHRADPGQFLDRAAGQEPLRLDAPHPAVGTTSRLRPDGRRGSCGIADAQVEMNRSFLYPQPDPGAGTDFLSGPWTFGGHGDPVEPTGMAVHLDAADASMEGKLFSDCDGEMPITSHEGGPTRRAVPGGAAGHSGPRLRAENFGHPFVLPELGPLGVTAPPSWRTRSTSAPRSSLIPSSRHARITHVRLRTPSAMPGRRTGRSRPVRGRTAKRVRRRA